MTVASPKISVIIPTYNGKYFLGRAVRSVISQTYQNWELIIVDDGSTDGTAEVIKGWLEKDRRIHGVFLHKNSGSPAASRNVGINLSRGSAIAFLDQDDIFLPENLEKKLESLTPEVDLVVGCSWAVDLKNKKIVDYVFGLLTNMVFHKSTFEKFGLFDESLGSSSDAGWFMYYLMRRGNENFIKTDPNPLALYVRHPEQDSNIKNTGINKFIIKTKLLIDSTEEKRRHLFMGDSPPSSISASVDDFLSWKYSRLGDYHCLADDPRAGRACFRKSINYRFILISAILYGASFFPKYIYGKIEIFLKKLSSFFSAGVRMFRARREFSQSYASVMSLIKDLVASPEEG